eukprot:TRINITY_DN35814_c0_g1_i1.p1 TRINITY_DN35814_c0_g1~~TRINITY_DN35814_c0_g1_i1.p1  ORF type:complete len:3403 (-),score=723.69 TRINITY_DN35814_c0_g1_i1:308-10516(-)
MIRTGFGPVGLRRPREPQVITKSTDRSDTRINKDWLAKSGKRGQDAGKDENYRQLLKQAMLIASAKVELQDISVGLSIDEHTGLRRSPAQIAEMEQIVLKRLKAMQEGTGAISARHAKASTQLKKVGKFLNRHLLVKTSKYPWAWYKYRYFTLSEGYMRVYKTDEETHSDERYRLYDIREAVCKFETKEMKGLAEPFLPGYPARVRLQLMERSWGPVFLYSKDASEAKSWERAIRMSKFLLNAADRGAIEYVVQRVAGSVMHKGWQALLTYFREMEDTKHLMRRLAMRLTKLDYSRGWLKLRSVYIQKSRQDMLRKEQQDWAARFLKEKMDRIGSQTTARSTKMVRLTTINKVQDMFRHFRQDHIYDRTYALGTSVNTRMQQMMTGVSMMAAFQSLNSNDVLELTLLGDGLEAFHAEPELWISRNSVYSEVQARLGKMALNVAENMAMLSFAEVDGSDESVLHKASWGHFVNLNQISSVIMHADRVLGNSPQGPTFPPASSSGCWFTVNGPRVGWGRRLRSFTDKETKQSYKQPVGSQDAGALGLALATGQKVQWFLMEVAVRAASVPDLYKEMPDEAALEIAVDDIIKDTSTEGWKKTGSQLTTMLVVTFLGRHFTSKKATGTSPQYPGKFVAEVPIPFGEQGLAALDETEIGLDVVEASSDDPDAWRTMWTTKMPLWKLFTSGMDVPAAAPPPSFTATTLSTLGLGGIEGGALKTMGVVTEEVTDTVLSIAESIKGGSHRSVKRLPMIHPTLEHSEIFALKANLEVEVFARVQDTSMLPKTCISPELSGRGDTASLFTSHRGAWHDPDSQKNGHVVELDIKELQFPQDDKADTGRPYTYQIEATCNGVKVCSRPLHRAKDVWNHVIPSDSTKLDWKGESLFVPLPPGCWSSERNLPKVEVRITRQQVQQELATLTFRELLAASGKRGTGLASAETVYQANLFVEGMALDHPRTDASIPFSKASSEAVEVRVAKGDVSPVDNPALLLMNVTLRDRDYSRLHAAQDKIKAGVICVGDTAMLKAEEPLAYPVNEVEFRRRQIPGEFDANFSKRGSGSSSWTATLRDPSLSHEYKASGLESLENPPPFKQRFMPNNAEDVIPYKFVMPTSEVDFVNQSRPGVFWRIMDDMVSQHLAEKRQSPADTGLPYPPKVVDRMSHLMKHIPVTVLAVYPDQTCDVEMSPAFIAEWESNPHKHYAISGSVVIGEHTDTSAAAIRSAPIGAGDVGERVRRRVMLKGVSLSCLRSVQAASFNVYDAALTTTEEVVHTHPNKIGNDYNPRLIDGMVDDMSQLGGHRGTYRIAAGPVPADANPAACQYEWQLHLNAKSEADMFHFITILRQATRYDSHEQVKRLKEFKQKSAFALNNRPYLNSQMYSSNSGTLEVVLVEARHLRPTRVQQDQDMHSWAQKNFRLDLQAEARFRLVNGTQGELIYKGSKLQVAPALAGNNPNWSEQQQLKASGGWVFKSPLLEASIMRDLFLEVEIMSKTYEKVGHIEKLGLVRVPVFGFGDSDPNSWGGAPDMNLADREKPYRNMWIPLHKLSKEGILEPCPYGEVHIVTIWRPSQETAQSRRLPRTVRAWQSYERKQLLRGSGMLEPTYEITQFKKSYDPNLEEAPMALHEAFETHIQNLSESLPYTDCCVRHELNGWATFKYLLEKSLPEGSQLPSLGDLRENWVAKSSDPNGRQLIWKLDELIRRGVPPRTPNKAQVWSRKDVWMQISRATSVKDKYERSRVHEGVDEATLNENRTKASHEFYQLLVDDGRPYRNDAMWQLNEDLVAAAAWERPSHHDRMDKHFKRLKRAQDICIALINFSKDPDDMQPHTAVPNYREQEGARGVAYTESLLVLAFFLLVAQTPSDENQREKTARDLKEEEVRAFWLLFTLIGGPAPSRQAYRDYFAVPDTVKGQYGEEMQIADRRGAMDDVLKLQFCLSRFEPELAVHLDSLGFHLSMVFYEAFMHLFAFLLPITSLFRMWDLLISAAARTDLPEHKHPRHGLIDLAFGGLRECKAKLLTCQSAMEVKNCLVNFYESIYDPTKLIEIMAASEHYLWDDMKNKVAQTLAVSPIQLMDYERAARQWERYFGQIRQQNSLLLALTRKTELQGGNATVLGNNQAANNSSPLADSRVTTKTVMKIINAMQHQFAAEGLPRGDFGYIIRQMPPKLLELGPDTDQSVLGQVRGVFSMFQERFSEQYVEPQVRPRGVGVQAPPSSMPEPLRMDSVTWAQHIKKCVGEAWTHHVQQIFDLFSSTLGERHLSTNEFFIALICCSKGTVSEKAIALFHLYAYPGPDIGVPHINPVSHAAGTIIERNEGRSQQEEGQLLKAPQTEDIQKMALHFCVYTTAGGASAKREIKIGEVFIPSLAPYLLVGMRTENPKTFTIWGEEKTAPIGVYTNKSNNAGGADALKADHKVRPYIGDMELDITWVPIDKERDPSVGQLGITLHSIVFNRISVEAPERKNPRVTVHTYGSDGSIVRLKRWDPRTVLRRVSNALAMAPPVGEWVDFEATMRRDPVTDQLWSKMGSGDHGWNRSEERWKWAPQWGGQFSAEKTKFRREVCEKSTSTGLAGGGQKPSNISLKACRLLVAGILSRSLHPVTHRQACLIADQIFSRCGAVPGIIDAVLFQGENVGAGSLAQAKEEFTNRGLKWVDVKRQVVLAHELHVTIMRFEMNLLPDSFPHEDGKPLNLASTMKIEDPFPGENKTLWIRYCRSGDGQRFNSVVRADGNGNIAPGGEVKLDMPVGTKEADLQMTIAKDEFVNCIISSPLLSESLRQLATSDNSTRNVPRGLPIRLDVTIADPTKEEADDELMDSFNVRQAVLLEVWDSDTGKADDFLGECWVPPLGSLSQTMRRFVLPMQAAPAEPGSTRYHSSKTGKISVEGHLVIEAAWISPAEEVPELPENADLDARVKREEARHTGKLKLKIVKAENLRSADKSWRRAGSDPYVCMYVRNEAFMAADRDKIPKGFDEYGWHYTALGRHECYWTTSVKTATRNPEWNEENEFTLKTGAFERRTMQAFHLNFTGRQTQRFEDDRKLAIIGASREELRIHFTAESKSASALPSQEVGHRHGEQIFMGENMHQFKDKLALACLKEAMYEKDPKRKSQFESVARDMSYRHVVTVFVPSTRLRELAQQGKGGAGVGSYEYKRLYRIEENDPSSWQPLDSICTFSHYAAMYSFGRNVAQRLRISDGTDHYKLKNNRLRIFQKEQEKFRTRLADMNQDGKCFGWAKFQHPSDFNSTEWRPTIVHRNDQVAAAKRKHAVSFVHSPLIVGGPDAAGKKGLAAEQATQIDLEEDQVLLAPIHPKILVSTFREHKELLAKAPALREQGMKEQDIVKRLNDDLNRTYEKTYKASQNEGEAGGARPPPITLADVQVALKHAEQGPAPPAKDGPPTGTLPPSTAAGSTGPQ